MPSAVPNNLVLGTLEVLQADWKEADPPVNLLHHVSGLRQCFYAAGELAQEKLATA